MQYSTQTFKSFLLGHCEKTNFEITPGSEIYEKATPNEVQMDDLAAGSAGSFPLLPQGVPHGHPESQKGRPGHTTFEKSLQMTPTKKPKGAQSRQNGVTLQP